MSDWENIKTILEIISCLIPIFTVVILLCKKLRIFIFNSIFNIEDYIQTGHISQPFNNKIQDITQSIDIPVEFENEFKNIPIVCIYLEHFDSTSLLEQSRHCIIKNSENSKNSNTTDAPAPQTVIRYEIRTDKITKKGFTIHLNTWNLNMIYGYKISWIAYGNIKKY